MLKYGFNALKAIPRLFSYRNDIDIYTEDRIADKEFYRTLFKNLLGDIRINDVTPMGCKANVLKAYDTQSSDNKRRKYFIIDGDLDLIIGTNRKEENNLIILDSYCIENYLIDEKGVIEFIYFSKGTESKENLKAKLNFEKWLSYNTPCLVDLFINFGILKKFGGGPSLNSANDYLKQDGKQTILDQAKIQAYSNSVKKEIVNLLKEKGYTDPELTYGNEYNELNEQWATNNDTLLKIVSAKNYLLPLLQFRITHCIDKGKSIVPKASIKLFLANNSSLKRLKFLKDKIK
ncbi:MAG: DUF4435 domain-containing protein [Sphingobacteriaceae bacterium]|nr:DUF4435 domain-containing protein [Sphingobacteriaceae bacterium]